MKIKVTLTIEANESAVQYYVTSGLEEAVRNDFEASLETAELFDLVGEINYETIGE